MGDLEEEVKREIDSVRWNTEAKTESEIWSEGSKKHAHTSMIMQFVDNDQIGSLRVITSVERSVTLWPQSPPDNHLTWSESLAPCKHRKHCTHVLHASTVKTNKAKRKHTVTPVSTLSTSSRIYLKFLLHVLVLFLKFLLLCKSSRTTAYIYPTASFWNYRQI